MKSNLHVDFIYEAFIDIIFFSRRQKRIYLKNKWEPTIHFYCEKYDTYGYEDVIQFNKRLKGASITKVLP